MATVDLDTSQIIATIKGEYLRPLIAIMGRKAGADGLHGAIADGGAAAAAAAIGPIAGIGAANLGIACTYKQGWNAEQFKNLATLKRNPAAGAGAVVLGILAPPAGSIPPAKVVWDDYSQAHYTAVYAAAGAAVAAAAVPAGALIPAGTVVDSRAMVKEAVLSDLGLAAGGAAARLRALFDAIFDLDPVLNEKTNRLIYNVPKHDEILRRLCAAIFAKKMGLLDTVTKAAGGGGNLLVTDVAAPILANARGKLYNTMPASDSDVYLAQFNLTPEEKDSLARYDAHVDKIRDVLSQGEVVSSGSIMPSNILPGVKLSSIAVFSRYPMSVQDALRTRRKSDPSNPVNTMSRIRISMNGGANNMRGGASSKTGPLYPKFVMHGGSHPLAVMEGGAAAAVPAPGPVRTSPNPVAVLDARIQELRAQFTAATNKPLGPNLSTDIDRFTNEIYTNVKSVQDGLNVLANANKALAQYPVGLGMDASTFNEQKLKDISAQAEKINKDAQKASKQLTKLEQISDTLAELVAKSTPAKRV
jgi:hypothetical protein